jgi:hypothetical protein
MKEREIGDSVYLKKPYRGYRTAEIIAFEFPHVIVRFSSGMEESFYEDEFEDE